MGTNALAVIARQFDRKCVAAPNSEIHLCRVVLRPICVRHLNRPICQDSRRRCARGRVNGHIAGRQGRGPGQFGTKRRYGENDLDADA